MIDIIYKYTCSLKNKNSKIFPVIYKINKLAINVIYPICHFFDSREGIDDQGTMIVSLTSFPKRIKTVWITITSIMNQSLKPKRIILWLAEEQFPNHKIPKSLTRLCKRGLEIRYCSDLKPHKKYFYAMKENPDDVIVTIDDDTFYPESFLELLYKSSLSHPNEIICTVSHNFVYDKNGKFQKYIMWNNQHICKSSLQIVPIGCGGILYPSKSLDKEVFNQKAILDISLYTDDLWLKCMSVKNNTKCYNCSDIQLNYFNNIFTQKKGLWKNNTSGENRNDKAWDELMKKYPEVKQKLLDDKNRIR